MILSFIYLAIGLILGNMAHTLSRNRESHASPTKFDFMFWWRDNRGKITVSLVIAIGLNIATNIDVAQTKHLLDREWHPIYSLAIGFFPDLILSFIKNKFGWLQPSKTADIKGKIYERK